MVKYLLYDFHLRGTWVGDLCHVLTGVKEDAEAEVGLSVLRLEMKAYINAMDGAFQPKGAGLFQLRGLAKEISERLGPGNVYLEVLFDEIVEANGWHALDDGSLRHKEEVWKKCIARLLSRTKKNYGEVEHVVELRAPKQRMRS